MRGDDLVGVVASFRPKDELAEVSRQLTRIRQYADALRSQAHEYANKLHTIAGLISIDAKDEALELIGQETAGHQALLSWIKDSVDDHLFAGLLLGKYNRASELGLRLDIDEDSNLSKLPKHIDSQQLVTLVGNLIDNALEATLGNNGEQVSLSFTDLGEEIVIEVEDQGPGIDNEQREAIFRQGYSTKGENRGIGLHLVSEICRQLNANITVETLTTQGSRFTLYIPRSTAARSKDV
jgi:two-component system CitB family sensor kinase